MTAPASAVQCSTQWNCCWIHSVTSRARSGSFVWSVQAWIRDPAGTRSSTISFIRATALSRVRTRSIGCTTPFATSRIGFTCSIEPKSACAPDTRPERLRYSRVSATASSGIFPAIFFASATASSNDPPSRLMRPTAVAMSAIPPASDRVSMTSMREPVAAAAASAVVCATEYVVESSVAMTSTRICCVPSRRMSS